MASNNDILVVGAGAAGLTMAIALARHGRTVTLVGPLDERRNGRTVALFEGSVRFYRALDLWPALKGIAQPIRSIGFVDATDALFRAPATALDAREVGLRALGVNIENAALVGALARVARATTGLRMIEEPAVGYVFALGSVTANLANGSSCSAALLVGADGRGSLVRRTMGVRERIWTYPQVATTALIAHERPHHATSTEFHTRSGPCTLVPMVASPDHPHRSSLVWLMTPDAAAIRAAMPPDTLARELEQQISAIVGRVTFEGPRGSFPMTGMRCDRLTGPRVALIADAGHFFPPIGAQGLNLGLRDVAQLLESVLAEADGDPGHPRVLADYETQRQADVATRTMGIDLLNRSLLIHTLPIDVLRSAGMAVLGALGPLRRALIAEGITPAGRLPALMQPARALDAVHRAPHRRPPSP